MTSLNIWFSIILLTVVTFITRGFFLLLGNRVNLPDTVQRALRYAPAAALVAVIVPEVFLTKTTSGMTFHWYSPQLWGGVSAVIIFLATRSMVLTIMLGMVVFTLVRLYL